MLALVYLTGYLTIVIGLFRQTTPAQVCLAFLGDVLPTPLKPLANLSLARPRE